MAASATELRLAADEHQAADLAGRLQLAEEQRLALEQRFAALVADFDLLRQEALTFRAISTAIDPRFAQATAALQAFEPGGRPPRRQHPQLVRSAP
jgi:hypothetical protein